MPARVTQEFACNECNGYFLVRLNLALNRIVEIVCPKCGHLHKRSLEDGHIVERGRENGQARERIRTTLASYSTTPRVLGMKQYARDGVPVPEAPNRTDLPEQWLSVTQYQKGDI